MNSTPAVDPLASSPVANAVTPLRRIPTTEYALWAVLRRDPSRLVDGAGSDERDHGDQVDRAILEVESSGTVVRGIYDVSSIRADADIMIWLHGSRAESLQWALRVLRRTTVLSRLLPTWNALGVHRDAEFSANHVPSFMRGIAPAQWLTVYPFVRSYDWYLLPEGERRAMLAEHGRRGSAYRSVLTNTVASFALGDYEWILALEDDELTNLVDLMRDLRGTNARMHVREEVPFFTGRRIDTSEILEVVR